MDLFMCTRGVGSEQISSPNARPHRCHNETASSVGGLATVVMATKGGERGKQAALRGSLCYLLGLAVGNLPKPLFGRAQPRHSRPRKPQIIRGSFPSGHNAAEVAYVFGASLEAPIVFLPLGTMALLGHLSLVKAGKHYVSDTRRLIHRPVCRSVVR